MHELPFVPAQLKQSSMQNIAFIQPRMRAAPHAVASRKGKTDPVRSRKLELYLGNLNWARAPPDSRGSATARADFAAPESTVLESSALDFSQFVSRTRLTEAAFESYDSSDSEGRGIEKPAVSSRMSFVKSRHLKGISEASRSLKRDLIRKQAAVSQPSLPPLSVGQFSTGVSVHNLTETSDEMKNLGKSKLGELMNFDSVRHNDGSKTERVLSTHKDIFPFRRFGIKRQESTWKLRGVLHAEDSHKLVSQLAAAIIKNTSLRELDVRYNYLDATAGVVLGAAIKRQGRISTLCDLPLGELQEDSIDSISTGGIGLGPAETVILSTFLHDKTTLTSLDLSTTDIGSEALDALSYGLRGLTQLLHLNLSSTGIRAEDMRAVAQGAKSYRLLQRLLLSTNMIDAMGAQILGRLLAQNRDLRVLSLRNNLIGAAGFQILSKSFGSIQHLVELDVANNNVGTEGMRQAGAEWGHLPRLQTLDLSFNSILPDGILHFLGELKNLRTLHTVHFNAELHVDMIRNYSTLDLRAQGFRSLEGFIVSALIRENMMISELDLRGNSFADGSGDGAYEEMAEAIQIMPRLKLLNDAGFSPHEHDTESISNLLRSGDQHWMSEVVDSIQAFRSPEPAAPGSGIRSLRMGSRTLDPLDLSSAPRQPVIKQPAFASRGATSPRNLPSLVSPEPDSLRLAPHPEEPVHPPPESDRKDAGLCSSDLDSCADLRSRIFKVGVEGEEEEASDSGSSSDDVGGASPRQPHTPYFRPGRSTRLRKPTSTPKHWQGRLFRSKKNAAPASDTGTKSQRRRALHPGHQELISRTDLAELSKLMEGQALTDLASTTPEREGEQTQRSATVTPEKERGRGGRRGFTRPNSTTFSRTVSIDCGLSATARGSQPALSPVGAMRLPSCASPQGPVSKRRVRNGAGRAVAEAEAREGEGMESLGDTAWNMAGDRVGPAGARALAARVQQEQGRVGVVDLALNNLTGLDEHGGGKVELGGFRALCAAWGRHSRLQSLNLAWNSLGPEAMLLLKPVVKAHPGLTRLDLYKNSLHSEGMASLAEALPTLTGLTDLDIRYNRVGPSGAMDLAHVLPALTTLRRLDAAHNSLGADGLADVAEVLTILTNLTEVDLRDNEGGKEGNEALMRLVVTLGHQLEGVNCLSMERLLQEQRDVAQLQQMLPRDLQNYEALFFSMLLQRADRQAGERLQLIYHHSKATLAAVDLSSCQLEEFPQSILLLTALEELNVSDNSISQVPAEELCALKYLHTFACKGNPHLYTPPPEVACLGGKRALSYLRQVVKSGEHDEEMALILIGPSEGGKSSCIRALKSNHKTQEWVPAGARRVGRVNMRRQSVYTTRKGSNDGRRPSVAGVGGRLGSTGAQGRRGSTSGIRGIMGIARTSSTESNPELQKELEEKEEKVEETVVVEMSQWRVSPSMRFSVYDLPGQELYAASNMLFLKHRAMYLFVWRVRSFVNEEAYTKGMRALGRNVQAWLETLQTKVRGAAILMVATHIDVASAFDISRQCDVVKRVVNKTMAGMDERKYGCSLHAFKQGTSIPVSCTTGDGLRELFDDIYKFTNAMDAFDAKFPRKFLRLRDELHAVREGKPWVKWKEYEGLAERCGIRGEELLTATPLLHQLGHLWYFGNIAEAVGASTRQLSDDLLLGTVIVSVTWMVDCIKGLLRQDRSMLLGWFAGDHGRERIDEGMVKRVMDLMSRGRIDPILLPFLWPRQDSSWEFWAKAMETTEKKLWTSDVVGDDHDCRRVVQLLRGLGLVALRPDGQLVVPTLVNGSHRWSIDARALSLEEGSVVAKRQYAGLPSCFFQLVLLKLLDAEDDVDFNNFAAAIYRFGMKGQLLVASAHNSGERTLTIAASHRFLWEQLNRTVLEVEKAFPGICVLSSTEPELEEGEAAQVTVVHSLYAMTQAEAIAELVQRLDRKLIVRNYELLQFRKILAGLSSKARDGFHKSAVDNLRKLRELAFTEDGALAHQRLSKAGIPDSDRRLLDEMLNGTNKASRLALVCLDTLAQSIEDTDLERVATFASMRVPIIVLLLPGSLLRSNLLPTRTPTPIAGIIDLRDPLLWRQEGHTWHIGDLARAESLLYKPIRTILENWRGLPPRGSDFSMEHQNITCRECVREQQLIPFVWPRASCEQTLRVTLKAQVASLDLREEPTELCGSEHQFPLLSLLVQPTPHVAIPCPNCVERGISPPFSFSRRKCISAIEPERGELMVKRGKGSLELECPLCFGVSPQEKERKSASKEVGKGEPKPLDLGKVLQPEVFVSFFRPQTSCPRCESESSERQTAQAPPRAGGRGGVRRAAQDGISTDGKCPQCIEGIHKRETVLQLMQRVERATGVCCVKRTAQAFQQPVSRKANSKLLKQAVVFIAMIDKDYVASPSCCVEFSHAVSSSIYILPVILPGYASRPDSNDWWPLDAKVKDDDGAWVAVPWSMLENFPPLHLSSLHDRTKLKAAEQHIMRVVMTRLYRGEYADHSTLKLYDEWKKAKSALLSSLGDLATMSLDELEEVVLKLFKDLDKDRSGYIDLKEMQHGLHGMGVRLTDEEAASMMKEADVDASMQLDPAEFRKVVFALMASSTVRMMQDRGKFNSSSLHSS